MLYALDEGRKETAGEIDVAGIEQRNIIFRLARWTHVPAGRDRSTVGKGYSPGPLTNGASALVRPGASRSSMSVGR